MSVGGRAARSAGWRGWLIIVGDLGCRLGR